MNNVIVWLLGNFLSAKIFIRQINKLTLQNQIKICTYEND